MINVCALIQVEYAFKSADLVVCYYSHEEYCEFLFFLSIKIFSCKMNREKKIFFPDESSAVNFRIILFKIIISEMLYYQLFLLKGYIFFEKCYFVNHFTTSLSQCGT